MHISTRIYVRTYVAIHVRDPSAAKQRVLLQCDNMPHLGVCVCVCVLFSLCVGVCVCVCWAKGVCGGVLEFSGGQSSRNEVRKTHQGYTNTHTNTHSHRLTVIHTNGRNAHKHIQNTGHNQQTFAGHVMPHRHRVRVNHVCGYDPQPKSCWFVFRVSDTCRCICVGEPKATRIFGTKVIPVDTE